MLKTIQRFLLAILLLLGGLYLAYEGLMYYQVRNNLPTGMVVAGVDVGGLSPQEATDKLQAVYSRPIFVYHREERVEVSPQDVGFRIDVEGMVRQALAQRGNEPFWQGFVEYVIGRSFEPTRVELHATHDREALLDQLQMVTRILDQPPQPPQLQGDGGDTFGEGRDGYVTDIEASLPEVEATLYRPQNREAQLVVEDQEAPPLSMDLLEQSIRRVVSDFNGVASVFVLDLETGEELSINGNVPVSGLSILKIPIFVAAYHALDQTPTEYVEGLFTETAVRSSNYSANLLLHVIASEDNTYEGAADLTDFLHSLGLVNTFMAVPYDAPTVPTRPDTYTTPANSQPNLPTIPDPARQTTAEDMGTLLAMVYHCAQGGGALLAVYPEQITPQECQSTIDLMTLNVEGNLIRFGVPEEVPVSHKHGWDGLTYGDAGLVLSPGGDYVIVEYLHQPDGWLPSSVSFPILWEISRVTYNYFNFDDPYTGDPEVRAEKAAAEAGAAITTTQPITGTQSITTTTSVTDTAETGFVSPATAPEVTPTP